MAIMDFNAPSFDRPSSNGGTSRRDPNAPKAQVWLNVGYDVNGKFVNLPFGLALDNMQPEPVRGQNEDWVKLQTARNNFLKALTDFGLKLEPGQEEVVHNLVIKIRRVSKPLEVAAEENEYEVPNLVGLLAGNKPVEEREV